MSRLPGVQVFDWDQACGAVNAVQRAERVLHEDLGSPFGSNCPEFSTILLCLYTQLRQNQSPNSFAAILYDALWRETVLLPCTTKAAAGAQQQADLHWRAYPLAKQYTYVTLLQLSRAA